MSVLILKSWRDVRRRLPRSLFTIATVAAAVASLSLFAMPTLMDRAMARRLEDDRLHDLRFAVQDLVLDGREQAEIRSLPGVTAIEFRTAYATRLRIGDRREDALLVGIEDFAQQGVNVVGLDAGSPPGEGAAISDTQNARSGRLKAASGTSIEIEDNSRGLHPLVVSGTGTTLFFGQVATDDRAVLYVAQETVNAISGAKGINSIDVRVAEPERAEATADAIRDWFLKYRPDTVFLNAPEVREAGSWPGQDVFENFSMLFYVGSFLALLSAVALISNTMTTMVAEQRREIAVLKAIGGGRLQVVRSFLQTAFILASAGAVLGIAAGVPFSNLLAGVIGNQFLGIDPEWGVAWSALGISVAVGIGGTLLAATPALLRASRLSVREGLDAGLAQGGTSWVDRVLRLVPVRGSSRVGLRNVARRKARTAGTVVQVGLAVGVALGFLALGGTIADVTGKTWDTLGWDVVVSQRSTAALDETAGSVIGNVDGLDASHPVLYNTLRIHGNSNEVWGIPPDSPLYSPRVIAGRWLQPGDDAAAEPVAVIGRALARVENLEPGDTVEAITARGPVNLRIVGIDSRLMNNGTLAFMSLTALQDILARDDANAYWLLAADQAEPAIDRLAATVEDELAAAGYPVSTNIHYVDRNANLSSNRTLSGVLAVMGIPIVAIGLIGLVNMMTMNVIERTREVGILRCVGARSGDIRGIFRVEALTVALVGWILAVPLGWLIGRTLVWIVTELFNFGGVPYSYPLWYLPVALVATLALAWLIVIPPVRRASRLRPGDALRYE